MEILRFFAKQRLAGACRACCEIDCPFVLVLVLVLVLDLSGFCGEKRIGFSPLTICSTALMARERILPSSLHGRDFEHEHEHEHEHQEQPISQQPLALAN